MYTPNIKIKSNIPMKYLRKDILQSYYTPYITIPSRPKPKISKMETKEEKSDISGKFLDLYEIRKELVNIEYSLSLVRKNCTTLEINLKKSEVVQKALEKLDEKTKIYESCGRIFALSSKEEVLNNLKNNKKEMIKELDAQNEKKKTLEGNLKEKGKEYDEVSKQKVGK